VVSINEDAHTENWRRFVLQLNVVVDVNIYDFMVAHIRK